MYLVCSIVATTVNTALLLLLYLQNQKVSGLLPAPNADFMQVQRSCPGCHPRARQSIYTPGKHGFQVSKQLQQQNSQLSNTSGMRIKKIWQDCLVFCLNILLQTDTEEAKEITCLKLQLEQDLEQI